MLLNSAFKAGTAAFLESRRSLFWEFSGGWVVLYWLKMSYQADFVR